MLAWQLRRVIGHMREHLAEEIDVSTLVALTGLRRAQFFRSFKRSVGRTPFAHLRHLRLLHARRLLADTGMSITGVAAAVGLEPTRLSALFREAYGLTPSAFRVSTGRGAPAAADVARLARRSDPALPGASRREPARSTADRAAADQAPAFRHEVEALPTGRHDAARAAG